MCICDYDIESPMNVISKHSLCIYVHEVLGDTILEKIMAVTMTAYETPHINMSKWYIIISRIEFIYIP